MVKKRLVIIGASGHGKVVADIAQCLNRYEEIVFLDDNETTKACLGFPVVGKVADMFLYTETADFIVAIGNANIRKGITKQLYENKATITTLIHPHAVLSNSCFIDEGTVIMAGVIINPDVRIGKGCVINTASSIDHESEIKDFAHISVGAHIAGNVYVGENTWVGAGAIISNNISVTDNCMIGSGAVVIKDIKESGTYVGVPAIKLIN